MTTFFEGIYIVKVKILRCLVFVQGVREREQKKKNGNVDKEYKTTSLKFEFVSHSLSSSTAQKNKFSDS